VRLTDGGLETSLIFHQHVDLPEFAAFPLLETDDGRAALRAYFEPYLALARDQGMGFVMNTPTWRANPDWAERLGYDPARLAAANRAAAEFATELADGAPDVVVEGVVGPRGDGYAVGTEMTPEEAADYHAPQIAALAAGGVDHVAAITMTYTDEADGILRAAHALAVPAVISFTVETDGRLPSGQPLREAIEHLDAENSPGARYFMVNCAHPAHFEAILDDGGPWLRRIGGLRANASSLSHAELDAAEELDEGDPADLGERHRALRERLPAVEVLGGCCGTDERHVAAIIEAWRRP
jgi:S-methylmethionine-dependent homocysteine/selenocysteine methylase